MKKQSYYAACAVPKPGTAKKKRKCNGYKDKPSRVCVYDGTPYAERHEVFGGPNRQTSIDLGFQIDVSPARHAELQAGLTKWAQAENLRLRQHFQVRYEAELTESGMSEEAAREAWIVLVGKNYL
jgi:hypothetical protein